MIRRPILGIDVNTAVDVRHVQMRNDFVGGRTAGVRNLGRDHEMAAEHRRDANHLESAAAGAFGESHSSTVMLVIGLSVPRGPVAPAGLGIH
jgi:hypothetical protein